MNKCVFSCFRFNLVTETFSQTLAYPLDSYKKDGITYDFKKHGRMIQVGVKTGMLIFFLVPKDETYTYMVLNQFCVVKMSEYFTSFCQKQIFCFVNVTRLITQPFWPNKIVIDQERICYMAEKLHQRNAEHIYHTQNMADQNKVPQNRRLLGCATPLP